VRTKQKTLQQRQVRYGIGGDDDDDQYDGDDGSDGDNIDDRGRSSDGEWVFRELHSGKYQA
jgi:hypothetical protein